MSSFWDDSETLTLTRDDGPTLRQRRDKWRRLADNIRAEACTPADLLQLLLQLQNSCLPTFCLLQIVQRHPLTIEATYTIGVGLELEPARA
jgi:hypothetical protein